MCMVYIACMVWVFAEGAAVPSSSLLWMAQMLFLDPGDEWTACNA